MNEESKSGVISFERRQSLLSNVPGFSGLPAKLSEELATSLREEHYLQGKVVVSEGALGDRLYLIESGRAEVFTAGPQGQVVLSTLEPGDMFGEIALLSFSGRRQATVKTLTPLVVLSLSAADFDKAMAAYPEARIDIAVTAETLLTAKLQKKKAQP